MFIDSAEIEITSGDGGSGIISFYRTKLNPRGGPDGGDGGRGGDVVISADRSLHTLMDFRYRRFYKAGKGKNGSSNNKKGADGNTVYLKVPLGTMIIDADTDELLFDMTEDGQKFTAASGGKGGRGNTHFRTSTNQAPHIYQPGLEGENRKLRLELKLLADVGLVGLPNAGKSTLLANMSAARPKIAPYPFTTLIPNLGIVKTGSYSSFVMADIPGLIEGAHQGKGLGDEFLKHIERTKVLVLMVDITSADIRKDFDTLLNELESFDPGLLDKPRIYVLTKADLLENIPRKFSVKVDMAISAVSGHNLKKLTDRIVKELTNVESKNMGNGN